jgi:hypothetical protein
MPPIKNPRLDIIKRNVYAEKKNPSPPITYNDMLNNMGVQEKTRKFIFNRTSK